MATETDKVVLELLRQELRDNETYDLAVKLYTAYREGGSKKVKETIYDILRNLGVQVTE